MADGYRSGPGLLDFELGASTIKGKYQLEHRIVTLKGLLKIYEGYSKTKCAIKNLIGALQYFQNDYLQALETFKEVLKIDSDNLNAKKNIQQLNNELGLLTAVERNKEHTSDLQRATFKGEQGFAILFDCFIETDLYDRFSRAVPLFKSCVECIDTSKSDIASGIGLQWKLWYLVLLQRLCSNCKVPEDQTRIVKDAEDLIKQMIECEDIENHRLLKSMTLTYQALFRSKDSSIDESSRLQQATDLFTKAKETLKTTETLVRYAILLRNTNESTKLEKAKELMDENIKLDGSESNWFGFAIRSSVCLKLGKIGEEDSRADRLQQAIEDGHDAARHNPTTDVYADIAEAFHLQAVIERRNNASQETVKQLFLESLANFLHATRHLDGKTVPHVHERHGDCLQAIPEYRSAAESYKRALECKGQNREQKYLKLMTCFMYLLEKHNEKEEEDEGLIEEIVYWLNYKELNTKKVLNTLWDHNDGEAMLILVRELLKKEQCDVLFGILASEKPRGNPVLMMKVFVSVLPYHGCMRLQKCEASCQTHLHSFFESLSSCKIGDDAVEEISKEIVNALVEARQRTDFDRFEDHAFLQTTKDLSRLCPDLFYCLIKKLMASTDDGHKTLGNVILHDLDPDLCEKNDKLKELCNERSSDSYSKEMSFEKVYTGEIFTRLRRNPDYDEKAIGELQKRSRQSALEVQEKSKSTPVCLKAARELRKSVNPKTRQGQFDFDFYVLHSDMDSDKRWVFSELLPTLEKKYGFKGCIEDRDFTPGRSVLVQNTELIKKSKNIIVVLTKDFNSDPKCMYFLHQAIHGKLGNWTIIPVQRDECILPEEMNIFVSLKAVKNTDWERLVKALANGNGSKK